MPSMWMESARGMSCLCVNEPAESDLGEDETACSACNGEDEAFDDLFADEACAASAECGADGGLSASRCRACDEQIRDIEAGDEQQASGGGEHGVEAGLEAEDFGVEDRADVGCVVDWARRDSVGGSAAWMVLSSAVGLCDGDSGLEPADRVEVMRGEERA